jgi:ribosomal protein S18 acetylase RimI-like enzyme
MVCYRDISFDEVGIIEEVWERNRIYHETSSNYFKDLYTGINFRERINGFSSAKEGNIKITLVEDEKSQKLLGYCISTFNENEGEPQTLHVIEEARDKGIGKKLMEIHLDWLKTNGCRDIKIAVSHENDNAINFYESLGFKPNTLEMRLK